MQSILADAEKFSPWTLTGVEMVSNMTRLRGLQAPVSEETVDGIDPSFWEPKWRQQDCAVQRRLNGGAENDVSRTHESSSLGCVSKWARSEPTSTCHVRASDVRSQYIA